MALIEANGIVQEYELTGPAGGAPLVLIHELGGSLQSWDRCMPALAAAGRRVLRYNWRGTGASEKIRGELDVATLCDDLAALIIAVGLAQPADVAGTALGGGVALAFAARHPAKVRRVAVSSPAIGGSDGLKDMLRSRADLVEVQGMRGQVDTSLDRSYLPKYRSDREAFVAYRNRWIANDPVSYASHNRMLAAMDETAHLARIAGPVLVIGGSDDALLTPTAMRAIADALPVAEFRELPTGHFLPVNTPDLWGSEVLPWLGEGRFGS
ncbi:MAG: alpha/beta fold hydrolase [Alphaproteobacteria bacterium]|nr:alpha/beta fold hydrolase [Alphaproteobacteria bacterium]MCB9928634.1 alpha/beta fold hydrolase [Alphaproteobacteria bacterium]